VVENTASLALFWSFYLNAMAQKELSEIYLEWMLPLPKISTPNFWHQVVTLEDWWYSVRLQCLPWERDYE
jgi:hypothetical protein